MPKPVCPKCKDIGLEYRIETHDYLCNFCDWKGEIPETPLVPVPDDVDLELNLPPPCKPGRPRRKPIAPVVQIAERPAVNKESKPTKVSKPAKETPMALAKDDPNKVKLWQLNFRRKQKGLKPFDSLEDAIKDGAYVPRGARKEKAAKPKTSAGGGTRKPKKLKEAAAAAPAGDERVEKVLARANGKAGARDVMEGLKQRLAEKADWHRGQAMGLTNAIAELDKMAAEG